MEPSSNSRRSGISRPVFAEKTAGLVPAATTSS
jgi:hypothetical protein